MYVCHWRGGKSRTRAVGASCARAADGMALLSWVRLALPLLYHSHCTVLSTTTLHITSQTRERERDLEDGGRGEFIEDMQRLKWGREREKLDRTLKHDGIISKGREGTTVKKSDK